MQDQTENRRLDERLAIAERRLARAERLVRCALALGALGVLTGLVAGSSLRAVVAEPSLKVSQATAPFQVTDMRGRVLFQVENASPGPHAQLFGSSGRPTVELGMEKRGGGKLTVFDRAGATAFSKP